MTDSTPTKAAEANAQERTVKQHSSFSVAWIFVCALLLALIVSSWLMHQRIHVIEANQPPHIVSFNLAEMISQLPQDMTPDEMERVMLNTRQAMDELSDAGYLVIDGESVLTRPKDTVIDVQEVLPVVMGGL